MATPGVGGAFGNPVNVPNYHDPMMYDVDYNAQNGPQSSIGPQLVDFYFLKRALIDVEKEMYFSQLSDTMSMPKHYGKTIKRYHYIPLLDDRNYNDQGIDATGKDTPDEVTIEVVDPHGYARYCVGNGSNATAAQTDAEQKVVDLFKNLGFTFANYAAIIAALTTWQFNVMPAVNAGGNLYGSSRDVGTITGKLPIISETGGRVNRVGFTRITIEASICNMGFFDEYTEDSVNFDTDPQLMSHISREALRGANQICEDCIQLDLLHGANVVFYGGNATDDSTLTGEQTAPVKSELTYDMLMKMETILDNNHCPKDTTIITGSRMIDTKTVGATRYCYCGPELKTSLMTMSNYFGQPAFIPTHQYAAAGTLAKGEFGAVGSFRFIINPQMMHWDGGPDPANPAVTHGAPVVNNDGYFEANGHYNVYPVLVVGSGSFTTIGFYTGGGNVGGGSKTPVKFKILHKAPGLQTADRDDPYGKVGFYSIQWWYGTAIWRPEWIGLFKVVAKR